MGKWDSGLEYDPAKQQLVESISKERLLAIQASNAPVDDLVDSEAVVRLAWTECFLIQLVNGRRAGEAHEMFLNWVTTGERVKDIRVSKRAQPCVCGHLKSSTSAETGHIPIEASPGEPGACRRKNCTCQKYVPNPSRATKIQMEIPAACLDVDRQLFLPLIGLKIDKTHQRLSYWGYLHFAKKNLTNTHSARYALIDKLYFVDHLDIQTIAAQTGQSLQIVEKYLRNREAKKKLHERAMAA